MFLCSTRLWSMAAMETDYFYMYFHSTRQLSLVTVMPFKVPDRSLQGFPFAVWPHLATHAAMSLLFWRVRQVLKGLKHISSRKWYVFLSWNCSHTLLSRWFMKGRCCELSIIFAYSIHHRVFISSHRHRCVHQNHESRCFLTKIIYNHFEGSFFSLLVRHHCMWSKTCVPKAKST